MLTHLILTMCYIVNVVKPQVELEAIKHHGQQPKLWWKYVEKLLSACISKRFVRLRYCTSFIPKGKRIIESGSRNIEIKMTFGSGKKIGEHFQSCFSHRGLNMVNFVTFTLTRSRTMAVLASVFQTKPLSYFRSNTHIKTPLYARNIYSSAMSRPRDVTFVCHLFKQLRLNATFSRIAFSVKNLFGCSAGQVTLTDCRKISHKAWKYKAEKFTYCGSVSRFSCFFPKYRTCMTVTTKIYTKYHITFSFSVMEEEIVRSLSLPKPTQPFLEWSLGITINKTIVHKFHVHVEQYNRVVIKLVDFEHISTNFHDGPEQCSPVLDKSADSLVRSSTFQIVAFVWTHQPSNEHDNMEIKYTTIEQEGSNISLSKEAPQHSLSFVSPVNSINTYHIYAPADYHVNVSVLEVTEIFTSSNLCLLGGLVVFEKVKTGFHKISTLCQQSEQHIQCKQMEKYRGIYTKGNAAVIIVYSSCGHGNFSVNTIISTTSCFPIDIHICSHHKIRGSPILKHFVTEVAPIKHDVEFYRLSTTKTSGFLFEISLEQCLVVQINSRLNNWILKHKGQGTCSLHTFGPKYIHERNRELQLRISGVLPFGYASKFLKLLYFHFEQTIA